MTVWPDFLRPARSKPTHIASPLRREIKRREQRKEQKMPLYMDIHKGIEGLTAQAVAGAHAKDLEVQKKHG
jgi:hypothetical protein